ncbi:coat protein [Crinivirus abutilonis]|uniref:Coat protein n=1 Tax=Crinivirus abutilonis TaxID=169102 RepID=Q6TGC7_9CLOS|nr:coat protein [Abutilon yellows virus]AAR00224.1 coat protein [Abutilon yellows virus]
MSRDEQNIESGLLRKDIDENDNEHQETSQLSGDNKVENVSDIFQNLMKKRDLAENEQFDPELFKNIKVTADRGDALNDEQNRKFEEKLKSFCDSISKGASSDGHFLAFYCSFIVACKNQSTSVKNNKQPQLINTFTTNGSTISWKTMDLINYMKANLPNVTNPIRQYCRRNEDKIQAISSAANLESDGHLAAKHGTTSQFWNTTADFINGSKSNISDDDLAANYLQRQAATKANKRTRTFYNVSQLAGSIE